MCVPSLISLYHLQVRHDKNGNKFIVGKEHGWQALSVLGRYNHHFKPEAAQDHARSGTAQ